MFFAALTFIAAFSIEAIGTVVSVIGLSTLFGANPIIMTLAVALDVGKLVVVALLYKYWGELNRLMKAYGLIAACITMIITSAGAAGYLAGEFQKAIIGTQEGTLKVQVLKDEQLKLETRKKQIDDQIANLPSNFSRSRVTLMKQFEEEQKQVTTRLTKINEELPQVQIAQISTEAKAGPILYIAKAFDITVEEAVKWVILMIIFVFDPLAVFLIVAGNFLLDKHRKEAQPKNDPDNSPQPPKPSDDDETSVNDATINEEDEIIRPVTPAELQQLEDKHALRNYPDTSQTKVYTRQDLIDLGVTDENLIAAGYEPREDDGPVARTYEEVTLEARPPIELEEEPKTILYPPNPEPSDFNQPVDTAPRAREQITKSTLGLVDPDPSVKGLDQMEIGYKTGAYRSGTQSK